MLLLGTGTTGLALAAAPQWSQSMFVGVVLIGALAVTGLQRRTSVSSRGSGVHGAGVAGTDQPGVASGDSTVRRGLTARPSVRVPTPHQH